MNRHLPICPVCGHIMKAQEDSFRCRACGYFVYTGEELPGPQPLLTRYGPTP